MLGITPLFSLVFGPNDLEKSIFVEYIKGFSEFIILRMPNFTNNIRANFFMFDVDNNQIYSINNLQRNQVYVLQVNRPLYNTTLKVSLTGAPGGDGGVVFIRVYYSV